MAVKCSECGKKIETSFMDKIIGTYIGKKPFCRECQFKKQKK